MVNIGVERDIGSAAYRPANPCQSEDAPMLYEVRTYTLRPGTVAEFEERFAKRLPLREKHSKLGAFWHTEFGPLNQVVHVYPYDDLQHRTRVRAAMAQDAARNALPGGGEFIAAPDAEIMNPAPFMHALGSRALGFAQELFDPGAGAGDGDATAALATMADQLPHLVGMLMEIAHDDPDSTLGWCDDQSEFEFSLDLILDGLDRMRGTAASPRSRRAPSTRH